MRNLLLLLGLVLTFHGLTGEITPSRTEWVPMSDDIELPMDLFFPKNWDGKPLPVILVRTPRSRPVSNPIYAPMAEWGYVVAVQDARNVVDAEGVSVPYLTAESDGSDTLDWLVEQDFCNGKIGTVGKSALGITQLLMAPSASDALKCQYISLGAPSLYHHAIFPGGQLRKVQIEGWLGDHSENSDVMALLHAHTQYKGDPLWEHVDSIAKAEKINAPAIHYGGWFDTFSQGTIDAFVSRQERGGPNAKNKQKLIMGPWHHDSALDFRKFGDFVLPTASEKLPDDYLAKAWFAANLKGEHNEIETMPAVTYYVMGPFDGAPSKGNIWKTADQWPVPAEQTEWFLNSDMELIEGEAATGDTTFTYIYDRDNPTPTIGGRNLFLEAGPKDQRPLEERSDVIVFTSRPLHEDIEVTGRLVANVFFSSEQLDTDVVVRLTDVYPDGRSILICDGITHLDNLLTEEKKSTLIKGEPVEVEVDLWSTSMVFGRGHRIRVSISSANYPRSEKALHQLFINGELAPSVTKNKVYIGEKYPTRLILPVVRTQATKIACSS